MKLRTQHAKPRSPNRRKLYGISKLPEQGPDSPPRQPTRPPGKGEKPEDRIERVNEGEKPGKGYIFESGAKGHGGGIVPRLSATDGEFLVTGRFDGRDQLIMIERKVSVRNSSTTRWQMLRQSLVAEANGFTIRWEVPDSKTMETVLKMVEKLKLNNVDVAVCK